MQDPGLPTRDSIRAVVRDVVAAPEFGWEERRSPLTILTEWIDRVVRWMEGVEQAHPVVYWTLIGFLTGLLIAVLAHLTLAVWRSLRPRVITPRTAKAGPRMRRNRDWYLEASARCQSEGRYAEALAHRFVALVLQLEERKAVSFHPAKTPWEYSQEARLDAVGRAALAELVATLYRFLFGSAACTLEDLERFDHQAEQLGERVAA